MVIATKELCLTKPDIVTPRADWHTVTQLGIARSGDVVQDCQKRTATGSPWKGPRGARISAGGDVLPAATKTHKPVRESAFPLRSGEPRRQVGVLSQLSSRDLPCTRIDFFVL